MDRKSNQLIPGQANMVGDTSQDLNESDSYEGNSENADKIIAAYTSGYQDESPAHAALLGIAHHGENGFHGPPATPSKTDIAPMGFTNSEVAVAKPEQRQVFSQPGVQDFLEKQFQLAQHALAAHHKQAMRVVEDIRAGTLHQKELENQRLRDENDMLRSQLTGKHGNERNRSPSNSSPAHAARKIRSVSPKPPPINQFVPQPPGSLDEPPSLPLAGKNSPRRDEDVEPISRYPSGMLSLTKSRSPKSYGRSSPKQQSPSAAMSDSESAEARKCRSRRATRVAVLHADREARHHGDEEDWGERHSGFTVPKQAAPKSMFVDAEAMKAKVKEAIMKREYNVKDFYHETGFFSSIAKSSAFEHVTLFVIILNSAWIAVDTDHNREDVLINAKMEFQVAENLFCAFFTTELIIRFSAFKMKHRMFRDGWFVFDAMLVFCMVFETWIFMLFLFITSSDNGHKAGNASVLRMARLLRLSRMARMARVLRALPELMILVKGILVATRSVFFTLSLLAIIVYLFGVAFVQLTLDTTLGDRYFRTIPDSMCTLLLLGTFPDLADLVMDIGALNMGLAVLFMTFVLLSSLTVLNMLVGVLVEVVSVVSAVEKEQMILKFSTAKVLGMLEEGGIDSDGNRRISRSEFESLLLNAKAARTIHEVGVDVVGLVDFADFIFKDDVEEISFAEFMDMVLRLRGSNTATVTDIVDLRKFVLTQLTEQVDLVTYKLDKMGREFKKLTLQNQNAISGMDYSR